MAIRLTDGGVTNEERDEAARCAADFEYFAGKYLWIVDRRRELVRFELNPVQARYHAAKTRFDIILKSRKVGISTYKCAEYFHDTLFRPNTNSTVIAHNLDTTIELFEKVRLFVERLPEFLKPALKRNRERDIILKSTPFCEELNSKYTVGTAGTYDFGRGKDIDNLHLSEYAFYPRPERIKAGALQALRTGGKASIESTADGFNAFHVEWEEAKRGESRFAPHFFAWFEDPACRIETREDEQLPLSDGDKVLMEAYGLDRAQLKWMLAKRRELRDRFPQEYPANDTEAFLTSVRAVFDTGILARMLTRAHAVEPAEHRCGLVVWHRPQRGRAYVIGADVAEGVPGGDASCAVVLDRESGEQAAELHGQWPVHAFAKKLDELGRLYNDALVGVERNNHGHTVLALLGAQHAYPTLYTHRDYDAKGASRSRLGWETNAKTKPLMVDGLAEALAEGLLGANSAELIKECLTYVYDERGATGAQAGCRDDRVIAAAIAWQLRNVPRRAVSMSFIAGA
ncbi:MAG: hypothetical protein JW889_07455 [Verrucomicrobia bacterium]|nr:hypothetical protein [Verrucomicrobiota bacterium]